MTYRSEHKYAIISPTKVRRVAREIQNKPYVEASYYLKALPHRGAKLILKVAESAVANALSRDASLDESSLFVQSIIVNEGPRMKRMWARARGRADVLLKRMSHISVVVTDGKNGEKK